jgi:hypothetical protein
MGKPERAPDRIDGLARMVRDYDERARGAVVEARRCLGARRNPVGKRHRHRQVIATYMAKLFINHDKKQTDTLKLLPAFYD